MQASTTENLEGQEQQLLKLTFRGGRANKREQLCCTTKSSLCKYKNKNKDRAERLRDPFNGISLFMQQFSKPFNKRLLTC